MICKDFSSLKDITHGRRLYSKFIKVSFCCILLQYSSLQKLRKFHIQYVSHLLSSPLHFPLHVFNDYFCQDKRIEMLHVFSSFFFDDQCQQNFSSTKWQIRHVLETDCLANDLLQLFHLFEIVHDIFIDATLWLQVFPAQFMHIFFRFIRRYTLFLREKLEIIFFHKILRVFTQSYVFFCAINTEICLSYSVLIEVFHFCC